MERIVYRITLDTHKGGIQRTLQGFETADTMSRQIAVSLVSGPDTYDLPKDHVTALMYISRDDTSEPNIQECVISGDTIIFDVPRMQEGVTELQLKLIEGDREGARSVLASPKFAVEVSESNTDDEGAEQTPTFTALENAIAKAQGVYDERLLRVDVGKDCVFRAYYADGSVYENYNFYEALYNGNALLSESWAKGGTGIRDGEDTNNAKYFSDVSKSAAKDMDMVSTEARELLEEARLYSHYTVFMIDFDKGELTYLTSNYEFDVDEETGRLIVTGDMNFDLEKAIDVIATSWFNEATDKFQTQMEQELEEERLRLQSISDEVSTTAANTIEQLNNTTIEFQEHMEQELEDERLRLQEISDEVGENAVKSAESEAQAKKYYEQSKSISESFSGAMRPMGTVTYAYVMELTNPAAGDMYNISDEFVTTAKFKEGSGHTIPAGSNIYWTGDNYWDVLAGSPVTGVKGDAESTYNRGNINITPAKIGAYNKEETNSKFAERDEKIENNEESIEDHENRISENESALGGLTFVKLTQSEYNALSSKDPNTIYFTTD